MTVPTPDIDALRPGSRGRPPRAQPHGPGLDLAVLSELRAALSAGAAPGAALGAAAGGGCLAPVARSVRLGQPLAEAAATVDTGDPAADLLVRALGVAELAGAGATAAVDQALDAVRQETALRRLIRVRTAQARGTAVVLVALPPVLWLLLVALDGRALGFYSTPPGVLTGALALGLTLAGHRWSHRLVAAAGRAAAAADPLAPPRAQVDRGRVAAAAGPTLVLAAVALGPGPGLLLAALVGALAARRRQPATAADPAAAAGGRLPGTAASGPRVGRRPLQQQAGGAAEAIELVAIALAGGLPAGAAIDTVAPLAPPAARHVLAAAGRRLRGGWTADAAFTGTGLAPLGAVLATADRWGAPAEQALRRLAADLRADGRAAAEEAAERVQLALVFPTTLLTLPAFVLGIVPPLLWTSLAGLGGVGPV